MPVTDSPGHRERRSADAHASASVPDALRDAWLTHRRWVAAIVLAHKPREAEVEDLLQDIAAKLVREWPLLDDPASVRPWLRTVAVNVARTAGRKASVRRRLDPEVREQTRAAGPSAETPDAGAAAREDAQRAMHAALNLPEAYREPLLLRAVRGLSYRQIADTLGVPVTTVETRLARARRMLRDQLDDAANAQSVAEASGTSQHPTGGGRP
jgi:RNA polymerase sigma-70 factor (ECF subfamily)